MAKVVHDASDRLDRSRGRPHVVHRGVEPASGCLLGDERTGLCRRERARHELGLPLLREGTARTHRDHRPEPIVHHGADEHLRASSLDHTILGPSTLRDGPGTGAIDVTGEVSGDVDRADVAAVAAATLADDGTIGRTIRFNRGSTPIAEALRGATA